MRTRLLDFTRSPYVAAYFALYDPRPEEGYAMIWARTELLPEIHHARDTLRDGNADFDHTAPAHPYACVDVQRLDAAFHRAERPRGYRPHPSSPAPRHRGCRADSGNHCLGFSHGRPRR